MGLISVQNVHVVENKVLVICWQHHINIHIHPITHETKTWNRLDLKIWYTTWKNPTNASFWKQRNKLIISTCFLGCHSHSFVSLSNWLKRVSSGRLALIATVYLYPQLASVLCLVSMLLSECYRCLFLLNTNSGSTSQQVWHMSKRMVSCLPTHFTRTKCSCNQMRVSVHLFYNIWLLLPWD